MENLFYFSTPLFTRHPLTMSDQSGVPVILPLGNRTQKESLSSYLVRGCRNGLNGNTKRGERIMRFPLQCIAHFELPTFSRRLLCSILRPGVERDVGHLAWLDAPNQFPNYVLPPDSRPKTRELYQNHRAQIKRDSKAVWGIEWGQTPSPTSFLPHFRHVSAR